jgi:hypothetical protein
MPKTVKSPLKKLAIMLVEQRKKPGLRQIELGKAIGFDPADMVRKLSRR